MNEQIKKMAEAYARAHGESVHSLQAVSNGDVVNHPQHYTSSKASCVNCKAKIECIQVTETMDFCLGNAVKYIWRYSLKNGLEDLKKARWYLDRKIKSLESNND